MENSTRGGQPTGIDLRGWLETEQFFRIYVAAALLLCGIPGLMLAFQMVSMEVYGHDEVYYKTAEAFYVRMQNEGRWINYLLNPLLEAIPGKLATLLNIGFLFGFCYRITARASGSATWGVFFGLLCVQATPFVVQVLWPASILPGFLVLFLSSILVGRLPVFAFYGLFGILTAGSMSYLYYLLPLCHLPLLLDGTDRENLKQTLLQVVPAWALGFLLGHLVMLCAVYLLSGQWGLKVAPWRRPNPVESFDDLLKNIGSSWTYLIKHSGALFAGAERAIAMLIAVAVLIVTGPLRRSLPLFIVLAAIFIAHYVIVLPLGIVISFRTVLPSWIALLAAVFLVPGITRRQTLLLLPMLVLMTCSLFAANRAELNWHGGVAAEYRREMLKALPGPAGDYAGVILFAGDEKVSEATGIIGSALKLQGRNMEPFHNVNRLTPIAWSAGFNDVIACKNRRKDPEICKDLKRRQRRGLIKMPAGSNLFAVLEEADGYVVLTLSDLPQYAKELSETGRSAPAEH